MHNQSLPNLPKSWYYLGKSSAFKTNQIKTHKMLNLELAVYRDSEGHLHALSRRCRHMQGDLSKGHVDKNCVRCPLHHWRYSPEGKCLEIPGLQTELIPKESQLPSYHIEERFGLAFLFLGPKPDFDLPFFEGLDPLKCSRSSVKEVYGNASWYVGPANAFDLAHFTYVHNRKLLSEAHLSSPHPAAQRIQLEYEVGGQKIGDRLITWFGGTKGTLHFTVYAGNIVLATLKVGKVENNMLIFNEPVSENKSKSHIINFAAKGTWGLHKVRLAVQSELSRRFFQEECDLASGISIQTNRLGPQDLVLKNYMEWLSSFHATR